MLAFGSNARARLPPPRVALGCFALATFCAPHEGFAQKAEIGPTTYSCAGILCLRVPCFQYSGCYIDPSKPLVLDFCERGSVAPDGLECGNGYCKGGVCSCKPGYIGRKYGAGCDYTWSTSEWTSCTAPCGGGKETRKVQCFNTIEGKSYSDEYCQGLPKPAAEQPCNTAPCPTYSWLTKEWSACSAACGCGLQTRAVTCVSNSGVPAADVSCAPAPRPAAARLCDQLPCASYSWAIDPWTGCSAQCGGGTQRRTVACVSDSGVRVADSLCGRLPRPATQQACNTNPCPTN